MSDLSPLAALGFVEECDNCGGTGKRIKYVQAGALEWPEEWPCPACSSRGWVLNQERLEAAAKAKYEHHVQRMKDVWAPKIMELPEWSELGDDTREANVEALRVPVLAFLEGDNE